MDCSAVWGNLYGRRGLQSVTPVAVFPKVPRPLHVKADLEQQAAWKRGDSGRHWHRKLHWTWIDSMTAENVGAAVNGLKHHTDVAALVWDGAGWY